MFSLGSANEIRDGIVGGAATFVIMCSGAGKGAHWINSKLVSPVVVGIPDTKSAVTNSPQQWVFLRTDSKMHVHAWNIDSESKMLWVDRGATKELLMSGDARIQYRKAISEPVVAMFSPTGIDRTVLTTACGNLFK